MILVNGAILTSNKIADILPSLEKRICNTLQQPVLNPLVVIEACNTLAERIEAGNYFNLLHKLIEEGHISKEQLKDVICLFKKESLIDRLRTELDLFWPGVPDTVAAGNGFKTTGGNHKRVLKKYMPLGVLFHIAAGNVDGLPAYSVIEGLLSGNINILKLPAADQGLTLQLLYELIQIEPLLAEYIYVFDTPSDDTAAMMAMAKCSDAIVVWGSDDAIRAVRRLASPNTKLIEWGHKLSFAYITESGITDQALTGLAHHIFHTKQLLCSSCQGIYIDTNRMSAVSRFCERFLPILEKTAAKYPLPDIGMQAQLTLLLYNQELESNVTGRQIYKGNHCSIIASPDQHLEASFTHGSCWVKALPRDKIIANLHRYKGYLQTVGFICGPDESAGLSELFARAGVTHITNAGAMSEMPSREAHDGEYPLRRYSRIVDITDL